MELARILPSQGEVQIVVTPEQNQVVFHCEQGERIDFVSRLIAGIYPPYQRSIPHEFTTRAMLETKQFVAAVGRASLFAKDEFKTARVTLKPSEDGSPVGALLVEADDADMGNHISTVAAEVTGPERHIIFPVRYLVEALERIDAPQVVFGVIDAGKPSVLKPMSEVQYTSMVMSAQEKKTPTA
jgi:DNA polymerase-3 subunit beta